MLWVKKKEIESKSRKYSECPWKGMSCGEEAWERVVFCRPLLQVLKQPLTLYASKLKSLVQEDDRRDTKVFGRPEC